jgi:meso-butanediol dehydrogenase/(S,S)-butanediol dehydrogenase/diacetyl reductase
METDMTALPESAASAVALRDRIAQAEDAERREVLRRLAAEVRISILHTIDTAHMGHIGGDFSVAADVARIYDLAEAEFGCVDISVQNAGVITIARIEDMTESEWDRVMAVNTKGVFLCCQAAIARMRKHSGGGRLINTASGQARHGFIFTPHYAASKFGVVGITQSLAKEVAKEAITVNAFCPGIIEADIWAYNDQAWDKLLGSYAPGELMAEWVGNIPMGRAGSGENVAGLVAFLAGPDAGYITGQTINVDGGLIMRCAGALVGDRSAAAQGRGLICCAPRIAAITSRRAMAGSLAFSAIQSAASSRSRLACGAKLPGRFTPLTRAPWPALPRPGRSHHRPSGNRHGRPRPPPPRRRQAIERGKIRPAATGPGLYARPRQYRGTAHGRRHRRQSAPGRAAG